MYTTRARPLSVVQPLEDKFSEKKQTTIIGFFCGTETNYDEIEIQKEAALGCLFLRTTKPPSSKNLSSLLGKYNSAFVRSNKDLYYINKQKNILEKIVDHDMLYKQYLKYKTKERKEEKTIINKKEEAAQFTYNQAILLLNKLDTYAFNLNTVKKHQALTLKQLNNIRMITPNIPPENIDFSFKQIRHAIKKTPKTHIYGYSGCHVNGGGFFAYGVDIPCDDLYEKVCVEASKIKPPEKVKLHLIGHSRGCISILQLILKINDNKLLKEKIEIIADLRDPVPGNLKITVQNDIINASISSQLRYLSNCACVKEVNITVQEETYAGFFSVLIPEFHPRTRLRVEYIPGHHSTQQTYKKQDEDEIIYILGFYKSLQILLENDIQLNDKEKYLHELIDEQIGIYNNLLNIHAHDQFSSRSMHFHGKFTQRKDDSTPTAFNARHAELKAERHNKPIKLSSAMLIYQGQRVDIKYSSFIHAAMEKAGNIDLEAILSGININLPSRLLDKSKPRPIQLRHILIFSNTLSLSKKTLLLERLLNIQIDVPSHKNIEYIKDAMLMSLGKQNKLTIKDHFIEELEQYCILRKEEAKNQKSEFHSFFGAMFTSMSATMKNTSAQLFLHELKYPKSNPHYNRSQITALRDGRLGQILSKYNEYLPEKFKTEEHFIKMDERTARYSIRY